jgi:hypothetical protein
MGELLNEQDKAQIDRYVQETEINALNGNKSDARRAAENLSNYVNHMQVADKREEAVARINKQNKEHIAGSKRTDLPSVSIVVSGEDSDGDTKIDRINGFRLQTSGEQGMSPLRAHPSDSVQPLKKNSDVPNNSKVPLFGESAEKIK